jgi:hypothetical protein
MKAEQTVKLVGWITVFAFLAMAYCFWQMTVPLSYDWVYVVVAGFIVSLIVFVIALITLFILAIRLRRSRSVPPGPS